MGIADMLVLFYDDKLVKASGILKCLPYSEEKSLSHPVIALVKYQILASPRSLPPSSSLLGYLDP